MLSRSSFLALTLTYSLAYFVSSHLAKNPNFTPAPNVDCSSPPQSGYPFCKPGDPMKRAIDLVSRLTLEEVINQTATEAPAIPRLGLKDYNWRSNCLHGWTKSGSHWDEDMTWTVFPAPIGLGATFDVDLVRAAGEVTSTEGRALHNEMLVKFNGSSVEGAGLNCFSPNVNLFRDPRWGRGQETYGEDPYLISILGTAYTRGLQEGEDNRHLKVAACAKHYVVHSGPEEIRNEFTANVSLHDLYDTYLPAFKSQVMAGKVAQMMPALSGTRCPDQKDGAPDVANTFLLKTVFRGEFSGANVSVCSDSEAIMQVRHDHHYVNSSEMAVALSMNATTDLDLGYDRIYPKYLQQAVTDGLVDEDTIRQSVIRSFYLRMTVGDFDVIDYQYIDGTQLDTDRNKKLNLEAARKSIVLLKNTDKTLPLHRDSIKRLAVIGPSANSTRNLLSIYVGSPSSVVSVLQGIENSVGTSVRVDYALGCDILCSNKSTFSDAVGVARGADYVIMVMGLNNTMEAEAHDRKQTTCEGKEVPLLGLPGCQLDLVEAVAQVNPRVLVVLINGGPLSIQDLLDNQKVLGILEAFYPGPMGGTAVADVLFGDYNPSGRMPVSTYHSTSDLPPVVSYDMREKPGRTYRYSTRVPLIPFGYGLSYSEITYTNMTLSKSELRPCESLTVSVVVVNTTPNIPADVSVLLFLIPHLNNPIFPLNELVGFQRAHPLPKAQVSFEVNPYLMSLVDSDGQRYLFPGSYSVGIGDGKGDFKILGKSPVKISTCTKSPQCMAC